MARRLHHCMFLIETVAFQIQYWVNTLEEYLEPHPYIGVIVRRVAGRKARFVLDGRTYNLA